MNVVVQDGHRPLEGRVAIVTGAAGGIGEAIAAGLAQQGAFVYAADIDQEGADRAAAALRDDGHDAVAVGLDVADANQVARMMELVNRRFRHVDILVNNAGVGTGHTVIDMPADAWRRVLDVNLTGAFLCCQAVVPQMVAQGWGKVVNVASIAGKRISYHGGAHYTAAKAGLLAFTRHLAYEVACHGVNVNAVCPGPTATDMLLREGASEDARARARTVPAGRLLRPADHVGAVLFLVSEAADMVVGVELDVDGGALLGWQDTETYLASRQSLRGGT